MSYILFPQEAKEVYAQPSKCCKVLSKATQLVWLLQARSLSMLMHKVCGVTQKSFKSLSAGGGSDFCDGGGDDK